MVSSSRGQTRSRRFPSETWAHRIESLPSSLEAIRGVKFDPDDAGSKTMAEAGMNGAVWGCPAYAISKALLNKVGPSLNAILASCHPGRWCAFGHESNHR